MTTKRQSLRGYSQKELEDLLVQYGEKPYRGRQVMRELFTMTRRDWNACTSLPHGLRTQLEKDFPFIAVTPHDMQVSCDGTRKYVFMTHDEKKVETVFIPAGTRRTVCLSTQIGCKYGCTFCMSGRCGLVRNLDAAEIVDQVVSVQHERGTSITNIVFMGMGEPFDNYAETMQALRIINDPNGLGIGARHITISTVGLPERIAAFATAGFDQVKLAISLHATNDTLRSTLMPVNRTHPIAAIMKSVKENRDAFKRSVTFEYVLLHEVNDSAQDAAALATLAHEARAKINLICYNQGASKGAVSYAPSSAERVQRFEAILKEKKALYTVRHSGGGDIIAACGQLSSETEGDL